MHHSKHLGHLIGPQCKHKLVLVAAGHPRSSDGLPQPERETDRVYTKDRYALSQKQTLEEAEHTRECAAVHGRHRCTQHMSHRDTPQAALQLLAMHTQTYLNKTYLLLKGKVCSTLDVSHPSSSTSV